MARCAWDGEEPARLLERRVMGVPIVLASVFLSLALGALSAEAQYFRAGPFAGPFRNLPSGNPGDVDFPKPSSHYAYPGDQADPGPPRAVATYRTLCVRLCDGFYFPISFAVPASSLARDAEQCRASCGTEARLFYHPNPGGSVESMFDLSGRAYAALPTAFTYRKALVAGCRCRPDPNSPTAASESMTEPGVLAPRSASRIDDPLALGGERTLVRPEPIVRDFPASSFARD